MRRIRSNIACQGTNRKEMSDTIFLEPGSNTLLVPRESASDPNYIKHVDCDGAYFHVQSYSIHNDVVKTTCSEKDCIINKPIS